MWKSSVDVVVNNYSKNHIDAVINSSGQKKWRFTGIYGHPEDENKYKTGLLLKGLWNSQGGPWLYGGDFNLLLQSSEKMGGRVFNSEEADILREAVDYCHLEDLGYVGHDFTWSNNRGGDENIQERLDRYLANHEWRDLFPSSFVSHLTKRKSDHLPILLCIKEALHTSKKKKKKKMYRFEAMWLRDENCAEIVSDAWERGEDLCSKIAFTSSNLSAWSREKFGDFVKDLQACKGKMEQLMGETQTEEVIAQMRAIDDRMDELERREEMYWKQRSRQDWLKNGDKNTTFFHTKTKQRAARNQIKKTKNGAGAEFDDEEQITEVFRQVEAQGFSGGIWMFWRAEKVAVLVYDENTQYLTKYELWELLEGVQRELLKGRYPYLVKLEENMCNQMDEILNAEEIIWFQKSRMAAISDGESNTWYFHLSKVIRRRRNIIETLKNEQGKLNLDQQYMSNSTFEILARPFSTCEVQVSLKSMHPYKAPGPNGFQPFFYQKY
uniref:Endonuclease/exonuclease/phosphatase domain-containing protein n=1 Tax=Chenopodium quinoa TaxID=63459 RepID=A0A803MS51_CHEQI